MGSAKLGISLNPNKEVGTEYNDGSDVDLVIASSSLFDLAWHDLLDLDFHYYKLGAKEREGLSESLSSIPRGFISPERVPMCTNFARRWWGAIEKVSNKAEFENRNIRARLFKNWWFAEKYYSIQLAKLQKH